jgi:hypothetical protein
MRSVLFVAWASNERAPSTNRVRKYRSPALVMRPNLVLPPDPCRPGTKPSHAASCRPIWNSWPLPMEATSAVAVVAPTPANRIRRWLRSSFFANRCTCVSYSSSRSGGALDCSAVQRPPSGMRSESQSARPARRPVASVCDRWCDLQAAISCIGQLTAITAPLWLHFVRSPKDIQHAHLPFPYHHSRP